MPGTSPRIARRREAVRQRILAAAAARLASAGPDGARLDDIAEAADVSRGTLYNHFPSKESLVVAVVRPVLERARIRAEELVKLKPVPAVEGLLRLYLEEWRQNPDALRLSYRMTERLPGELQPLHDAFHRIVWKIFQTAASEGVLRAEDPMLAGRIAARTAVPLLELLCPVPGGEKLFYRSMRGLLLSRRRVS
jgi:AcrR family transcriptional regulator